MIKFVVIALLAIILVSLGSGLVFLVTDRGRTKRPSAVRTGGDRNRQRPKNFFSRSIYRKIAEMRQRGAVGRLDFAEQHR